MKSGKAFETLVKSILINIGFNEVKSDGLYIYGKTTNQKINGLGEVHDADVLLEPPVQIPFSYAIRLLVECKDFSKRKKHEKVGLDIIRGALGLRDDVNAFDIVDNNELKLRQSQNRGKCIHFRKYNYSVAVASTTGFSPQAQSMASTYRIPLIEFDRYPFWNRWEELLSVVEGKDEEVAQKDIRSFVSEACAGMAVAVTNTSQLLFLFSETEKIDFPEDEYEIHQDDTDGECFIICGGREYFFGLPEIVMEKWTEKEAEADAEAFKEGEVSRMVVYYRKEKQPYIKMLFIKRENMKSFHDEIMFKESVHIDKYDGDEVSFYDSGF